jgi:hypothetical protein
VERAVLKKTMMILACFSNGGAWMTLIGIALTSASSRMPSDQREDGGYKPSYRPAC